MKFCFTWENVTRRLERSERNEIDTKTKTATFQSDKYY